MTPLPKAETRRDFLRLSGATVLSAGLLGRLPAEARRPLRAASRDAGTLVCIFLRGGADALATVIPYTDETYYAVRPTISIPEEAKDGEPGVIKLDERYGMHPSMKALEPWWQSGHFAPILAVGSPHPTRSHFDAQDFMEYAAPGDRTFRGGWLNRYLLASKTAQDSELRALAMQGLLPRSLRGEYPVLAVPGLRRRDSEGMLDLFDDVYRRGDVGDPLAGLGEMDGMGEAPRPDPSREKAVAVGRNTIDILRRFWDITESDVARREASYPRGRLGQQLKLLATVIHSGAGLEVACLDVPSWDHHQGEGAADGLFQSRMSAVADSIAAFAKDLGPKLATTNVLVMTEFGRTVAENGNRGTDHGRGSVMLALGGRVAGGRVHGDYGSLLTKHLQDGRDLVVRNDFRTVFQEVLEGSFGFSPEKDMFPDWKMPRSARLGLMKPA